MRPSTFNAYGDRKTSAVHNGHELGALAGFGWPNGKPPFFAAVKVPPMKVPINSRPPRSLRVLAGASRKRSRVLSCTHSPYRRWQIGGSSYRSRKSFQRAPVRCIHWEAIHTSRLSRRRLNLRPGPVKKRCGLTPFFPRKKIRGEKRTRPLHGFPAHFFRQIGVAEADEFTVDKEKNWAQPEPIQTNEVRRGPSRRPAGQSTWLSDLACQTHLGEMPNREL